MLKLTIEKVKMLCYNLDMEKKITLKNLYEIAYFGKKPFESEKSLADFFYVNTIAAMVEKQINAPKRVGIVDIICYFSNQNLLIKNLRY